MTSPFNPVAVESAIHECSNRISNGVRVCDQAYRAYQAADRTYDQAYARAYLAHRGPAHAKKYAAEVATAFEREERDTADAAYRYADRTARALESELRALQSVGASVRAMYSVAGAN